MLLVYSMRGVAERVGGLHMIMSDERFRTEGEEIEKTFLTERKESDENKKLFSSMTGMGGRRGQGVHMTKRFSISSELERSENISFLTQILNFFLM